MALAVVHGHFVTMALAVVHLHKRQRLSISLSEEEQINHVDRSIPIEVRSRVVESIAIQSQIRTSEGKQVNNVDRTISVVVAEVSEESVSGLVSKNKVLSQRNITSRSTNLSMIDRQLIVAIDQGTARVTSEAIVREADRNHGVAIHHRRREARPNR